MQTAGKKTQYSIDQKKMITEEESKTFKEYFIVQAHTTY